MIINMCSEEFKLPKRDFFDDMDWINENRVKIRSEYQGRWIAVSNKKVLATSKKIDEVEEQVALKTKKQIDQIPIVYIEDPHCIYMERKKR